MTAAASRSPEPYEVPEGGLGSFLTATVGDWSDEALNADNYYDVVKPTADQLAQFGREEDDRIAHVATGETIIPMAVFEEDPALKEAVFNRMMEMGIDPERYIVGNELNSINPVTGQPEFFLKKIFKGIKKAVKGVVKVFKKLAPIVLSVGLSFIPGVGPILAATLGSGIGTLIQGGNLKDALKAAAIGGITAGVTSGISNVVKAQVPGGSAGGTFMEGVRGALPGPETSAGRIFGAPADAAVTTPSDAVSQVFTPEEVIAQIDGPPAGFDPATALVSTADDAQSIQQILGTTTSPGPIDEIVVTAKDLSSQAPSVADAATQTAAQTAARSVEKLKPTVDLEATGEYKPSGPDTIFEQMQERQKLTNALRSGDLKEAFMPRSYTAEDILEIKGIDPFSATNAQYKAAEALAREYSPNLLRKYGPAFLGIAGLGAATGAFEVPEMEPLDDMYGGITGMDLLAQNPLKYRTYAQRGAGYNPPPVGAAGGGSMDTRSFPRRDGAISGPGTETSDDIPAMLSDGEFVMTARAVRGAGNGSREAGMRKMYNMMSQFERAV